MRYKRRCAVVAPLGVLVSSCVSSRLGWWRWRRGGDSDRSVGRLFSTSNSAPGVTSAHSNASHVPTEPRTAQTATGNQPVSHITCRLFSSLSAVHMRVFGPPAVLPSPIC
ncbi:hypothetical protein VZT92_008537 [Zoarces viviparus]|uniref:Secreted protein n=1 Tax=Zoarces viviparus TaxID=48416 RepID=A0AAW1FGS3_ZOAVI